MLIWYKSRKPVWEQSYRGFESLPLRSKKRNPRNSLILQGVAGIANLQEAVCERFCEIPDGVCTPARLSTMSRKTNPSAGHTGRTAAGHTRDVKIERIGKVTIYKRGETYSLYYRQGGLSHRRRVDGNLAVARATAHKVQNAIDEGRASPIAYSHTSPDTRSR